MCYPFFSLSGALPFRTAFTYTPQVGQARCGKVGPLHFGHTEGVIFFSACWERRRPTFDFE